MRKHNGMRPQDIVVLLKIISLDRQPWQFKDLARQLMLSPAEISESLNRSQLAGLVDTTKRKVSRLGLFEFIRHGLHYVFPQAPGPMVNGLPTAHSHAYFKTHFKADLQYVWPLPEGKVRGLSIQPLYATLPQIAEQDEQLYLLLACIDIIRVGRQREIKVATEVLKEKILKHEPAD